MTYESLHAQRSAYETQKRDPLDYQSLKLYVNGLLANGPKDEEESKALERLYQLMEGLPKYTRVRD